MCDVRVQWRSQAFWAAQLSATPALLEPMFRMTAQVPQEYFGGVQKAVSSRRGVVDDVGTADSATLVSCFVCR